MTGAMYAAVSGLKSHMQKLNVIGNNVANVNTYAYKAGRVTFKESLYTTLRSGSNGSGALGGVNPSQIGYGCSIGSIDLDMSTKNYMPTGLSTDCMIDGDGFLMVGSKPDALPDGGLAETKAQDLLLSRMGDLYFDNQGYLVDRRGQVVYGFVTCSGDGEEPGVCADPPKFSTQLVPIRLPLAAKEPADPDAADAIKSGTAIFPGIDETTGMNVYDQGAADGLTDGKKTIGVSVQTIAIDGETGKITAVNTADSSNIVVGYIPLAKVANPNGVTHIQGPYYRAMEGAGECQAALIGDPEEDYYLNNAEADAANRQRIFGSGGTALIGGGLESSGTDVASEFTEMITTQRGYQANTRIITVTDAMLEELVNIKR